MKRTSLFSLGLLVAGALFAQVQTISLSGVNATITPEQIQANGQNHNASRGVIYLDFEGLGDIDAINDFYNGGTSAAGYSGTDYGVEFGLAFGKIDFDDGGSGNFANEPSPSTIMYFQVANQAYMNVPAGFTTGFSFYYSANTTSGFVSVYDGLDGTGNLLATQSLTKNFNLGCTGDPNGDYCNWDAVSVTFSGTAKSVVFGGTAQLIGFDDITFGSTTPGAPTPVSNWALILGIALILGFAIFRIFRIVR